MNEKLSVELPAQVWQRIVIMFENTLGLPFKPLECISLANEIAAQCQKQQGEKLNLKETKDEPK